MATTLERPKEVEILIPIENNEIQDKRKKDLELIQRICYE